MMLLARLIRSGTMWCNLPLRLKAAVWVAAPLVIVSLLAGFLSALHLRLFPLISIAGLLLLALSAAGLVECLLHSILRRSIGALANETEHLTCQAPVCNIPPHNRELERVWQNVELASSFLDRQRCAAEAAANRAARMFEESPLASIQTDPDGIIQCVNRAAVSLLGRPATELDQRPLSEILGPVSRECEKEYIHPDGRRMLLSVRGEAGDYALTDISERLFAMEMLAQCARELNAKNEEVAKALARAAEAEAAEARFLSGMSNEWRVPLNVVIGFAELMCDGMVGAVSPEQRECLEEILGSGRQLLQTVDARMERARTDSAETAVAGRRITDVEPVIQEVCSDIEADSTPRRRTKIAIEVDPAIARASVDAAHLKQVVQAYLASAVKLSPKSGRIAIRAAAEGRTAIRLEVEYKLMASYFRPGEAPPGNDATLALAKEIIEPHGGRVGVRLSKGRSTILFAEFPLAQTRATEPALPGTEIGDQEQQVLDFPQRSNSLIVTPSALKTGCRIIVRRPEDRDQFRDSLAYAGLPTDGRRTALVFGSSVDVLQSMLVSLTGLGYKPICVRDVHLVLEAAAQWEPFAILLDLSTSGIDEFEFIETELRSAGLSMPLIGFLNRELTPGDYVQAHHQLGLLGIGERDANLPAVCKLTA